MNETAMKGLVKLIKNIIPPETIKQATNKLIESAIEQRNEIILDPEAGETQIQAAFYEVAGETYFSVQILNDDNQVLRSQNVRPLDQLIDELLNNM